jgi:hypothetical protein
MKQKKHGARQPKRTASQVSTTPIAKIQTSILNDDKDTPKSGSMYSEQGVLFPGLTTDGKFVGARES